MATKAEVQAAMIRRAQLAPAWRHLVEVHHLPMLTERQYMKNKRLWDLVHQRMHEMHDIGFVKGQEEGHG